MVVMTLPPLLGLLVMAGGLLWQQQKKIQALSEENEHKRTGLKMALFQPVQRYLVTQLEDQLRLTFAALVLGVIVLLWLLLKLWRQRKKIQALLKEKEGERAEKEAAQVKAKKEQNTKEKLQDELMWTRIPYLPREEQSQVYAGLKMALFQPADVFLDPDTAHPALCVSEDKRSLQRADTWEDLPENLQRFRKNECVLGCVSFTSGRHFWEVEVGDRVQWCVGVCSDSMSRKGHVKMVPESGFWTVGLNPQRNYVALMDPPMTLTNVSPSTRVGVFLDYELGKVSFYNAMDGSHIFTFPQISFSGPLRPVFLIGTVGTTPLTICQCRK